MTQKILVEIVFATTDLQVLEEVQLPSGSTVADAIAVSSLADRFPEEPLDALPVGIWGRVVARNQPLKTGDRVEIYRELKLDPMEARRIRASARDPGPSGSH